MRTNRWTVQAFLTTAVVLTLFAIGWYSVSRAWADEPVAEPEIEAPKTVAEARARAVLMHELINGTLQVVHRDFFDDESPRVLPSQSFDDVFEAIAEDQGVKIRWLTVNADEMSVYHRPSNDFEIEAVEQLISGKKHHDQLVDNEYRYVGAIRLGSQCLKCHVVRRVTLEDRLAGVSIRMPMAIDSTDQE